MKKKYSLTDEHREQLRPWADKWIANALDTRRIGDDWPKVVEHVQGLYRSANLTPPPDHRVIRVDSPIMGARVATMAAMIWWLRENPDKHVELCGRQLTEGDYLIATEIACGKEIALPEISAATRAAVHNVTFAAVDVATRAAVHAATYAAVDGAIGAATSAETRDAVDATTRVAVNAATREAPYAATHAATREATRAATNAATRAAVDGAIGAAIDAATNVAVDAATYAAVDAATNVAVDGATRAATHVATYAAVSAATDAAVHAATNVATSAAVDVATRVAVHAATHAAVDDATYDATYDATHDAVNSAAYAAIGAATSAVVDVATRVAAMSGVVRLLLEAGPRWLQMYSGGALWSGWSSYLSFFRHVAGLDLDYSEWDDYEALAQLSGMRLMHEKFTIVCERHTLVRRNERNQPHCEDGPAIAWADGTSRYYWHGLAVPAEWIENKESIHPSVALTHDNAELGRALCEILGWERVLEELDARTIDKDHDPMVGELLEADLPDVRGARFLKMLCGTGRTFCRRVPSEMTTAIGAQAWMWQVTEEQYRQLELRT